MAKVIAEIGINHNGQLDIALELIRMACDAGADAVKFQVRTVSIVYAGQLDEPRDDDNPYGWKTVGEQKHGLELSIDEYEKINQYCRKLNIPWFYSAWDIPAAERMRQFECHFSKIASPMITNLQFCEWIAANSIFTFISTGGSTIEQINMAIEPFVKHDAPFCLMHCTSQYPCPVDLLQIGFISKMQEIWPMAYNYGYSGHEVGLYPSVAAMAFGAKWIERHITLDRSMYGSDQSASMEYPGLKKLCDIAHDFDDLIGDYRKKILPGERSVMKKLRYWEKNNE